MSRLDRAVYSKSRRRVGTAAEAARRLRRAFIDALEQRVLFSTYVVLSAADDSGTVAPVADGSVFDAATLRDAIHAANVAGGSNTITLGFSSSQPITLDGTPLEISNATGTTTLEGAGVTICGNGASAVFQIDVGANAEFDDLTIAGGTGSSDGGVNNAGTLVLNNTTVCTPLSNQGTLWIQGDSSAINGTLTTYGGSAINLTSDDTVGDSFLTIADGFTNNGAINLTDNSSYDGYSSQLTVSAGTLTNAAGGTITTAVAADAYAGAKVQLTASIDNAGSFTAEGATTLNNQGQTFTNTGTVSVAAGQTFTVNYGNFNEAGGALSGSGTIDFSQDYSEALLFNVQAPFSDGGATLLLADAVIDGPAAFTNVPGTTLVLDNTTVNAPLVNEGTLSVQGDSTSINGAFTTASGSAIDLTSDDTVGDASLTLADGFTNNGAINLTNNSINDGYSSQLTVSAGTLTNAVGGSITTAVAADAYAGANVQITASIDNAGIFSVQGAMTLNNQDQAFTNAGTVSVAAAKTFTVNYGEFNEDGGALSGSGTINFSQNYSDTLVFNVQAPFSDGGATLLLGNAVIDGPAAFTNTAGATLVLNNTTVNAPLVNEGTLLVQGDNSTINGDFATASGSAIDLTSDDTVGDASLTAASGFTNNGAINLTNNSAYDDYTSQLTVSAGTLTNAVGGSITTAVAAGAFAGADVQLTASIDNAGTFSVAGATTLNNQGQTFTNTGTVSVAAGQTFTVNYGEFNQDGGALSGSGTLDFSQDYSEALVFNVLTPFSDGGATLLLANAVIDGPAAFTNVPGTTLLLNNTIVNAPLVNQGTLSVQGDSTAIDGAFTTASGSVINLTSDDTKGDASLTVANGFTNNGAINLTDNSVHDGYNSRLTVSAGTLTNAAGGTITTAVAAHAFAGANVQLTGSIANAGTFSVQGATTLNNPGGQVSNTGTLSISDAKGLTIDGNYSQSSSGTVNINIAGTAKIDALTINGSASFAGSLGIVLANGFVPTAGQTFKVVNYSSHTGTLALINPAGLAFASQFNSANLVITAHPPAPTVTTNPANQSIPAGQTVTFTAAAIGNPAPTVQWQVSTNGGKTFANITSATSLAYSFKTTATQTGYEYRAVFTNSKGTATSTAATLTVTAPLAAPMVTTNPMSQTVAPGASVTFTAAAAGNPKPTVQWQVSTNAGKTYANVAGATATSYKFTASKKQTGYLYRAVFTNSQGTATTKAATLTV